MGRFGFLYRGLLLVVGPPAAAMAGPTRSQGGRDDEAEEVETATAASSSPLSPSPLSPSSFFIGNNNESILKDTCCLCEVINQLSINMLYAIGCD